MKQFDLTTVFNEDRPMSWSAISSFEWNPRQWHEKYVIHGKCKREKGTRAAYCVISQLENDQNCPVIKKTPELVFGSETDQRIQDDPEFLPQLIRFPVLQHEMKTVWNGIPLIGYADTYMPPESSKRIAVRDYKTGRKKWDKKRADETGQLTMYLFMIYLENRKLDVAAADLYIDWLPTHFEDGKIAFIEPDHTKLKPVTFKTKRSMVEVLNFGRKRIPETWAAMQEYASREQSSVVHRREDW